MISQIRDAGALTSELPCTRLHGDLGVEELNKHASFF
jgi:hypothetical protein